ncbi:M15 family metallopeptidase [Collimonas silvisoli]|uniref:M15 family metallopeptidase n=1 Tax=Collimonas silvisoli TaxID=2825884 RepID=UPI001B8BB0A2|nr:M15 family metallopeptidase [Collimonas silvisoli]
MASIPVLRLTAPLLLLLAGVAPHAGAQPGISTLDSRQCAILKQHVLQPGAPVDCPQLQVVRFAYIDFDQVRHDDGEIMVMAAVAPQVKALFDELFKRRFPLAQARLMEHYQGNDDASMADNNTSAFNDRPITGGKLASLHAYGLAIDINPLQNPYVLRDPQGQLAYSPPTGQAFGERVASRPGSSEQVVELFAQHGFLIWGGDWKKPIDYQHFQVSRKLAERLAKLPLTQARQLFESTVAAYRACRTGLGRKPKDRVVCAATAG